MSNLTDAKTFKTFWYSHTFGKFVGRIMLPLFVPGSSMKDLVCDYSNVRRLPLTPLDSILSNSIRAKLVAVKCGYAPATLRNLTELVNQSVRAADKLDTPLYIDDVLSNAHPPRSVFDSYLRYVNLYLLCERPEADIVSPLVIRNEEESLARHEEEARQRRIEAERRAKAEARVAKRIVKEQSKEVEYKSGGKRNVGLPEFSCDLSLPDIPAFDTDSPYDDELSRVVLHLPRAGLLYREHLLGNGNDYVNRPVESTVDRDWLKGH